MSDDKKYKLRDRPHASTASKIDNGRYIEDEVCPIVLKTDDKKSKPKVGNIEVFDFAVDLDEFETKKPRAKRQQRKRKQEKPELSDVPATRKSSRNFEGMKMWLNSTRETDNKTLPTPIVTSKSTKETLKVNEVILTPPNTQTPVVSQTPETQTADVSQTPETEAPVSQKSFEWLPDDDEDDHHFDDDENVEINVTPTQTAVTSSRSAITPPTQPSTSKEFCTPRPDKPNKTPTHLTQVNKFNLSSTKYSTPASTRPPEAPPASSSVAGLEMFGFENFLNEDASADIDVDDELDLSPILKNGHHKKKTEKKNPRRSNRVLKIQNQQTENALFEAGSLKSDGTLLNSSQESVDLFTDDYDWSKSNPGTETAESCKETESNCAKTATRTTTNKKETKEQKNPLPVPNISFDEYYEHDLVIEKV